MPKINTKAVKPVTITGEKTVLRPKQKKDIQNDFKWRTDIELSELDATLPINLSYEQFERISINDLHKSSPWSEKFSIDNLNEEHIGNCMFYDINRWEKSCEFGIMIGNKTFWNSGYGTDAAKNLLFYIFNYTDINEVYLHTLLKNNRAQKSFSKAGFENPKEVKKGKYEFIRMSTLKEEWINKFNDIELKATLEEEQD